MRHLKNKNLVSEFSATEMYPLDQNHVLKHLPTSYKESEKINSPMFNDSMVSVLRENCGISAEKVRHVSKRGQKIIPG